MTDKPKATVQITVNGVTGPEIDADAFIAAGHNSKRDVEAVARDQLRAFIERIERLDEEITVINLDKRDIYAEAKGTGFDPKIIKKVIAIRRQDRDQRAEEEAILETYLIALGMLESTPDA